MSAEQRRLGEARDAVAAAREQYDRSLAQRSKGLRRAQQLYLLDNLLPQLEQILDIPKR